METDGTADQSAFICSTKPARDRTPKLPPVHMLDDDLERVPVVARLPLRRHDLALNLHPAFGFGDRLRFGSFPFDSVESLVVRQGASVRADD